MKRTMILIAAALGTLCACSSQTQTYHASPAASAPSDTRAASPATTSPSTPASSSTPASGARSSSPPSSASADEVSPVPAEARSTTGMVRVPDAVKKSYLVAQREWRSAGLAIQPAKDALGMNRVPLLPEEWVVTAQNPRPGTKVPAGTPITATIRRFAD